MRLGILLLVLVATLFSVGYWYTTLHGGCVRPITYRIGDIDASFDIERDVVLARTQAAERMWEMATGRDLFTYDPEGAVVVRLVFDNRQAFSNAEAALRHELDTQKDMSDSVRAQYESLLVSYGALETQYKQQAHAYEHALESYNTEVATWNEKGGAPAAVFADLEVQQQMLEVEQQALHTVARKLNALARDMNTLSAKGAAAITDYNEIVERYNKRFTEEHEFTQGSYQNEVITIYQYDSLDELQIVLAHELGHALQLDHVEQEESIMYHLLEAQSVEIGVTEEDIAALESQCHEHSSLIRSIIAFFIT